MKKFWKVMVSDPSIPIYKMFDSEDAAEGQALELLERHPNCTFYVMECTKVISYPKQPIQITKL